MVIESQNKHVSSARVKLTLWYLLIIMAISGMFSMFIYHLIGNEIERFALTQRFQIEPDLVLDAKHRIGVVLLSIDGVIFVVSASLGYFLAGRTLQPIQEMLDEQNRFVSDASHELRTPLTSLRAAFEVHLRDKKRTLKDTDILIRESLEDVNKLQTLSESLLQLVQYEKKAPEIVIKKIAVKQIIDKALRVAKPLAAKRKIKINTKIADVKISGDLQSLTDAVVTILDNAIKYSLVDTKIDIVVKRYAGQGIISISDQGAGIKKEDLPYIFDRFFRGDPSRTKSGYGLGLSIAKKIVQIHHGEISVNSKVGIGTTFQLKFNRV